MYVEFPDHGVRVTLYRPGLSLPGLVGVVAPLGPPRLLTEDVPQEVGLYGTVQFTLYRDGVLSLSTLVGREVLVGVHRFIHV